MRYLPLLGLGTFLCVFGCRSGGGGGKGDSATLTIVPAVSDLLIENGVPATQAFTAVLTSADGETEDVTAESEFSIAPGFGQFQGNTLSALAPGETEVSAIWNDETAEAQVVIRLRSVRVGPTVPFSGPSLFDGPEDPLRAPSVVYPDSDTTMLRNMGVLDVHWTDASTNDVYEISLKTELTDVLVYVTGSAGDVAAGPDASWVTFLPEEWAAAIGDQPSVELHVRGVDTSAPVPSVGSAPPRTLKLPNEDTSGALYYWAATTQGGPFGIFRHFMDEPGVQAEPYLTTAQTENRCVGCHVLSRDGTRLAISYDPNTTATFVDVASATPEPDVNSWNFGTFTPDGAQFLSVRDGQLVVRSSDTQEVLASMTSDGYVTHPDLSPDGTRLVYVRPDSPTVDWSFDSGAIYWRTYDPDTYAFGPELPLVDDAENNYYPSFSPDGAWIVFNSAPVGIGAYNNPSAALWVIDADGAAPPVELTSLNLSAGLTNSWGRWAPYVQTVGDDGDFMFWLTVSSMRDFGTRLVDANRPQIWMAPFSPDRAAAGEDPTGPPFRVPFQDLQSDNHLAQWTQRVIVPATR